MKKFLLTLLGASLLCGLSPHPLSAQTTPELKTATFEWSADAFQQGRITAGHRINGAMPKATDPTDFTLNLNDQPALQTEPLTGVKGYGWGLVYIKSSDNDEVTARIDFDYSKSPVIKGIVPYKGTSQLSAGSLQFFKEDDEPSTAFSISLGEGKRIKSVEFIPTEGANNEGFYVQRNNILSKYIQAVENFQNLYASKAYTLTDSTITSNSFCTTFTFSADGPYGAAKPLCLRTMYHTSTNALKIQSIKVTYVDATDDMPSENIDYTYGKRYGDPIYYMDENDTEWIAVGDVTERLEGKTVKVKIGESITEFSRYESLTEGQPTVIINGRDQWVGATIGCKFHTYLDPSLTESQNEAAYRVTYSISEKYPSGFTRAYYIRSNLTAPSTGIAPTTTITEELLTITNMAGLSADDAVSVNQTPTYDYVLGSNPTEDQKNGTDAAVIFDQIRLTYTSSKPHTAQGPMVPDVKMPSVAMLNTTTGIYTLFGSGKATISSFAAEVYTGITYRYALTDTPLDETTFTTQNSIAGNEVEIDGSKHYLAVRAYAMTDGKEIASAVRNFEFEKSDILNIDRAADLNASLKDRTVRLTFPLNILADGTMGSDKLKYMIYARDPENNPVVMVSRLADVNDAKTPGAAFQLPAKTTSLTTAIFVPAGGVIATVDTDDAGHVILVLKDAAKDIDHFDECYTGSALAYNHADIKAAGITDAYTRAFNTHNRVEKIDASHYGRMIYIRGVNYNTTDKTFEKDGVVIPTELGVDNKDLYLQSSYYQIWVNYPKSDIAYTICGIVEYDSDNKQYYLMLRNYTTTQDVTEIKFNTGQVIEETRNKIEDNVESIDINHTATTLYVYSNTINGGYIYTYDNHSTGLTTEAVVSFSSKIPITKNANFFKDGVCELKIQRTEVTMATNTPYDRGDIYTIKLIDRPVLAKKTSTLSEMKASLGENPADGIYTTVTTPYSKPWEVGIYKGDWNIATIMIAYIRGNYMLVRDIARNGADSDYSVADDQQPNADFYLLKSHAIGWVNPYKTYYRDQENNGKSKNRSIQEGDGIAILTGSTMIDNGNLIIVPAGTVNDLYCTTGDTDVTATTPLFEQYTGLDISASITDPDATLLGNEHIGKVLSINGVTLKAPESENAPYIAKMKSDVKLSWKRLGIANKDADQAVIAGAGDDATYNVTAYVMNDGNGGIELEVISLECLTNIISVCEHEHHDTYFGNASLDRFADGDAVTLRGVKVTKTLVDGSNDNTLWTTIGNEEIEFVWITNATQAATQKKTITDNMPQNTTVTRSTFDIIGTVKEQGGKKSIDVSSVALQPESSLKVQLNGSTVSSTAASFYDYAKITFTAPQGVDIAYQIVEIDGEPVADAKWQTVSTDDVLSIDRTHVIKIAGCNASNDAQTSREITFSKLAQVVGSIEDMLVDATEKSSNYLHQRNAVRISSAFTTWPYGNIVTVTDDAGHHLICNLDNNSELPEIGAMIKDFVVQRVSGSHDMAIGSLNSHYQYSLLGVPSDYVFTPEEGETLPSIEPMITDSPEVTDVEKLIRIIDAHITGDNASGLNVTTVDGNTIALRNAFECEIADYSPESGYTLTGLLLPRKGKSAPRSEAAAIADEADESAPLTLDDMEFLPLNIEKRRAAAAPILEVTGFESKDNNTVVTIDDVTVSMTADEEYATIEYSLDGGNTWTTYDGKPITISNSTKLQARTIVRGLDTSAIAVMEIRREYYSEEAVIAAEQKSGYTAVTFAAGENASADTDFTVYYTLDGTEPDMNSAKFTAGMKPLELTEAVNVKALMVEEGKRPAKSIASQAVTVRANDLEITAEKGEGFTTVTIAPKDPKHVDPKAEIRYTTDGTEPTAQSKLYTAPFEVEAADNGMTVKAICIEPQKTNGLVATQTVAVEGLRPSCDVTITYREEGGIYYITLTAEAGTIHYSLNGAAEKIYDGNPIEYTPAADGTCTITAYALEEGKRAGKTATESFAVTGISGVGTDEAESVSVEGNTIIVPEGAQTFDIAGRRVNPQGLPRGIYIVRLASGKAVKVVVK